MALDVVFFFSLWRILNTLSLLFLVLPSPSSQGRGLKESHRQLSSSGDGFLCDQLTWSVYNSYPRHSNLDLDTEGAGANSYCRGFPSLQTKAGFNAPQVVRKWMLINKIDLQDVQLKSA